MPESKKVKGIVFEEIDLHHLPLARKYVNRGFNVYHLNAVGQGALGDHLKSLSQAGSLQYLPLDDYPYVNVSPVANRAFEVTDKIYDHFFKEQSIMIRLMRSLYKDDHIHLAFKKQLLTELTEYFHCQFLRTEIEKALPQSAPLLFVPSRLTDACLTQIYDKILDQCGLKAPRQGSSVIFSRKIRWDGQMGMLKRRFKPLAACCYTMLCAGYQYGLGLMRRKKKTHLSFDFAITVVSPVREFANEIRGSDFLLDGKDIRKDNTLFVPLLRLKSQHVKLMKDKGFNVASVSIPIPGSLFLKTVFNTLFVLCLFPFVPEWIFRVGSVLALDYLTWNRFSLNYKVKKFITGGDFGFKQISRNILLKQKGVETWYFIDTENLGGLNFVPTNLPPFKHYFWGYLYYDHFVAWSDRVVAYHQTHKQQIGHYHAVGCLWSEHIRLIQEGVISSRFKSQLRKHGLKENHKMIAVFDSSYSNHARTNYDDGIAFAHAIEELMNEIPDLFVVWKEKKPRSKNGISYRLTHWGDDFNRLVEIYNRLEKHPRFYFAGYSAASAEIMACADMTVSFPFTSPTVESLGARNKAIYYVPNNKFPNTFFETIPGLVVRNHQQLVGAVRKILYEVTNKEHESCLSQFIEGKIYPSLDGQALTRFRNLLCDKPAIAIVEHPLRAAVNS